MTIKNVLPRWITASVAACGLCGFLTAGQTRADSITFTGTGNNGGVALSATATFSVDTTTSGGPYLKVQIVNTASSAITDPANLLTVLDFHTSSAVGLTTTDSSHPSWAVIPSTSTVEGTVPTYTSGPFAGLKNAGTMWGLMNITGSNTWAVGTTGIGGMGLGQAYLFNDGSKMNGLGSPPGGIEPAAGGSGGALTSQKPYFSNEVDLYIYGISSGFDPKTQISNVQFFYGTSNSDSHFGGTLVTPVPLPSALGSGLCFLGILALGAGIRKKFTS